jgi:hypothetical protein
MLEEEHHAILFVEPNVPHVMSLEVVTDAIQDILC